MGSNNRRAGGEIEVITMSGSKILFPWVEANLGYGTEYFREDTDENDIVYVYPISRRHVPGYKYIIANSNSSCTFQNATEAMKACDIKLIELGYTLLEGERLDKLRLLL